MNYWNNTTLTASMIISV